jgi:hypothetical protein
MELFYFALGVLTVFALILMGSMIVGMIKVSKIQRELSSFKDAYRWDFDRSNRYLDDMRKDNDDRISNVYHNLDERENKIYQEIRKSFEDSVSYTDKRIDKAILHYKET